MNMPASMIGMRRCMVEDDHKEGRGEETCPGIERCFLGTISDLSTPLALARLSHCLQKVIRSAAEVTAGRHAPWEN